MFATSNKGGGGEHTSNAVGRLDEQVVGAQASDAPERVASKELV
jgi:hypothetical protein